MALYVNTNVSALNGQKNLANVTNRLNTSFERLSSGSRINTAKDDAAGLQISDRLTTQVIGLKQATRNANDGISIAQIAEGALAEVTNNVQRMRQLTVQGGNTILSQADRTALAQEFNKLLRVNEDIANRTAFGEQKLLDGTSPDGGFTIQSGAYDGERDTITTGNATLVGLLTGAANDDESITASTALMSLIALNNLSQYGVVGDIIAGYVVLNTGFDLASLVLETIFGAGATTGTLSNLSDRQGLDVDFDKITKILADAGNPQSGIDSQIMSIATIMNEVNSVLSAAGLLTTVDTLAGFTGDQAAALRNFATDKLLGAMSELVARVGSVRATLGAEQNGLASVIRSNQTAVVNVSDSRSRIVDTDFAEETAELTRNQIIQQASNSILAQANQLPQAALSLLNG